MKHVRNSLLLLALVTVSFLMSCNKDNTPTVSEQQKLTDALTTGTWTVDATATNVSNVTGSPDATTFTITFADGGNGVVNFTLGGAVADYFKSGSFSVAEDGTISNFTVSAVSTDLSATLTSVTVTETKVTLEVEVTQASSRVGGIGTYTLVFTAPAAS